MRAPSSQGHYLVAASSTANSAYVRVVGLGSMNNCAPLQEFLDDLRQKDFREFIFDLSACEGFDSTFMGVLIGYAVERRRPGGPRPPPKVRIVIVNVGGEHRKLLRTVGVDRVVDLCDEPVLFPPMRLARLKERELGSDDKLRRIVEAHENLIDLDGANQEKFGDFVEMVRRELARSSGS